MLRKQHLKSNKTMNKEIQDKAWAVMPQELKDELRVNKIIKTSYNSTTSMENKITMDDFCKSVGKTEEGIKNGGLDLRGTGITSLPDGLCLAKKQRRPYQWQSLRSL